MEGGDAVFLGGEDLMAEIDWTNFFDDDEFHDGSNVLQWDPPTVNTGSASDAFSKNSPDSVSSWIDGIERLLMKDDDDSKVSPDHSSGYAESFLADLLVDSPTDVAGEAVAAAASTDSDPNVSADVNASSSEEEVEEKEKEKKRVEAAEAEDDADDPISKKRRRQLRNRDAAVRSRERKKTYVKDLEMKSKYLEGECRRLGRLLQCCYAENQALRATMQMGGAFGASTAKQESAVLLLESLLLGSLLRLVLLMCLFTLPVSLLPRILGALQAEEHRARKAPERVAPREVGKTSETFGYVVSQSCFVKTRRRCKASWTKMKHFPDCLLELSLSLSTFRLFNILVFIG